MLERAKESCDSLKECVLKECDLVCVAVCCSVLQCVAVCCSVCCSLLQCVLQCVEQMCPARVKTLDRVKES